MKQDNKGNAAHQVVIIGGGFAGLGAAQALAGSDVEVTLIDRRNFHLFQPLLFQVASGVLSPANIARPLRNILRKQRNARVLLGEVVDIDLEGRQVLLSDGAIAFDTLVVAAGASHSYFGNDQWQHLAPGLKTIEDATEIRQRLLTAFEAAERAGSAAEAARLLTFVVVGGGPTGVELAGAVAEITRDTLRGSFRRIDPSKARVVLVEGAGRVLPQYDAGLSAKAGAALRALGVEVLYGARVTDVQPHGVEVKGADGPQQIPTGTVIWAAGVKASPLGALLAEATGGTLDRNGRLHVDAHLNVPGHPNVFVAGDLAHAAWGARAVPGVAPAATQAGSYVGQCIARRLAGGTAAPFAYVDYGSMATIGRGRAVADLRGLRLTGFVAWSTWLAVHLLKLSGLHNRLMVALEWGWCFLTGRRAARLITGTGPRGRLRLVQGGRRRALASGR